MQKRTSLKNEYLLKERFTASLLIEDYEVWISTGNFLNFQGKRNELHRHSYYEVCLVLDGKGEFLYDEDKYKLKGGDLFIADPGVIHEIISDDIDHLKIQFISFSFSKFQRKDFSSSLRSRSISDFIEKHTVHISSCNDLAHQFHYLKIASLETNRNRWYLRNLNICSLIIQEIILYSTAIIKGDKEYLEIDNRLNMALQYIDDNCFRKLSVDEIADHAAVSPRTLRRLMHEKKGTTIIQNCLEKRISKAGDYLLSHPDKSIAETSYHFGFDNPSDFSRAFKKIMNVSPVNFRENNGTVFS